LPWQRAISLASVLKPVADLCQRQAGLLRQLSLVLGRRISLDGEALFESAARALLEAVNSLLAVPYVARQRELASKSILVDGSQRPTTNLLRLGVVTGIPQLQNTIRILWVVDV